MACNPTDVEDDCYVYPAITKRYSEAELGNQIQPTCINTEKHLDNIAVTANPGFSPRPVAHRLRSTLKTQSQFTSDIYNSQNSLALNSSIQKPQSQLVHNEQCEDQTGLKLKPGSHITRWNDTRTATLSLLSAEPIQMSKRTSIQQLRKYSVVDPNALKYFDDSTKKSRKFDVCSALLITISYVIVILTFPLSLLVCIKVVAEYERVVVFRLGRILPRGARGPGLFFIAPCIDSIRKVDLRTVTFDVPPQEVLTKDSVTVAVDAVVYYRIYNPVVAITNVEDADRSTRLLAATTLRNVLGTKNLAEILSERESISTSMQAMLDDATDPWGVKVERVEVKDVRLPVQLQRAMAAEAEATREARAKVIAAEGEEKASVALKQAADVLKSSPFALQLRYLQTLSAISAEKNSTIIFPLPVDMLANLVHR